MTNDTFAPDAVRPATELRHVLELRKLQALTPYKLDGWDRLLRQADLFPEYAHISDNLRFGFFIKLPPISFTQTPPNCPTIVEFHCQFTEIVWDKFGKGCYIGPFSRVNLESLIGPFQSSPFSIIPKLAKPNKF
jgi:hypothetical protein